MVERVGISKQNSLLDISILEGALRDDLDAHAPRRMAVIDPLKVVLTNVDASVEEFLRFANHPKDEAQGEREIPFGRELWIEREDFEEVPPKGFKRLTLGGDVRLRGAGIMRCDAAIKDAEGRITELHCTLDLESRPGMEGANRKVKGTIHWVSANDSVDVELRLYDRLFSVEDPDGQATAEDRDFVELINPNSLQVIPNAKAEPCLGVANAGDRFQFMRKGYFICDQDSTDAKKVFNLTVNLRDTWKKG